MLRRPAFLEELQRRAEEKWIWIIFISKFWDSGEEGCDRVILSDNIELLIISDSFVLHGWRDEKFSGDSDSQLPTGCPTLNLDSDSQNICINFVNVSFSNTSNHYPSKWSFISGLWSIWNTFLDAIKLTLKFHVWCFYSIFSLHLLVQSQK